MAQLNVQLDLGLFEAIRTAAAAARKRGDDLGSRLVDVVKATSVFGGDADIITARIADAFEIDRLMKSDFWERQEALVTTLRSSLAIGLRALDEFLPDAFTGADVTVHLVPGFSTNYGPTEGVQVFALHDDADPAEALLFLLHVCYHEATSSFYSEASREASARPDTPVRFRHWLMLLIQNEGVANFAVLDQLLELRDAGRAGRYFTYAPMLGHGPATAQAMTFCRRTLASLDQSSVDFLRGRVTEVLKNPSLPVIPLVGIHLAATVADAFGPAALRDAAGREPVDLFRIYAQTNDALMDHLFGPGGQDLAAYGLDAATPANPTQRA